MLPSRRAQTDHCAVKGGGRRSERGPGADGTINVKVGETTSCQPSHRADSEKHAEEQISSRGGLKSLDGDEEWWHVWAFTKQGRCS